MNVSQSLANISDFPSTPSDSGVEEWSTLAANFHFLSFLIYRVFFSTFPPDFQYQSEERVASNQSCFFMFPMKKKKFFSLKMCPLIFFSGSLSHSIHRPENDTAQDKYKCVWSVCAIVQLCFHADNTQ